MRQRKAFNQINVVPYIDVMLVLLVIFMVTAPLITPGEIELPSVGQKPRVPSSPMHIVIEGKGRASQYLLRDERAGGRSQRFPNVEAVIAAIVDRQQDAPDQPVVIEADKSVPYGEVVSVLDRLQRSSVAKVGLLVQPPQK